MIKATGRQRVSVSDKQREELETLVRRTTVSAGLARRSRAILLLAEGYSVSAVARQVRMQRRHLYKWMKRFGEKGIVGLQDEKRSGRPPVFSPRGRDALGQDCLRASG
jgi:transposase